MGLPTGVEQKVAEPVKTDDVATAEEDVKHTDTLTEADTPSATTADSEPTESAEVIILKMENISIGWKRISKHLLINICFIKQKKH